MRRGRAAPRQLRANKQIDKSCEVTEETGLGGASSSSSSSKKKKPPNKKTPTQKGTEWDISWGYQSLCCVSGRFLSRVKKHHRAFRTKSCENLTRKQTGKKLAFVIKNILSRFWAFLGGWFKGSTGHVGLFRCFPPAACDFDLFFSRRIPLLWLENI
jgi:hypothetical protein